MRTRWKIKKQTIFNGNLWYLRLFPIKPRHVYLTFETLSSCLHLNLTQQTWCILYNTVRTVQSTSFAKRKNSFYKLIPHVSVCLFSVTSVPCKILSNSLSCIITTCFPLHFPLVSLFVLIPSRLLCLSLSFMFDHICLHSQQPYKFTVADVAMRENGSSVDLRTLQIPPALVLSDFAQRRSTGSPLFSLVLVYFSLWSFSRASFQWCCYFPSESYCIFLFLLAFCSSPCTISPLLQFSCLVPAFYLSFATLPVPFFFLYCASCCVFPFIIRCQAPRHLSSLLIYFLSSFFPLFPADILPPNSLD